MRTTALIVAAGAGQRMGASQPKAFLHLDSRPLVEFSLAAFQNHPRVDAIVLMVPAAVLDRAEPLAARYPKLEAVMEGGRRRQDTVRKGIESALARPGADAGDVVLVHDAARPLVDEALITSVLEATLRTGAAVPGIAPADTLRRRAPGAGDQGRVLSAGRLDRDTVVLIQTPQGFRLDLLRRGFEGAGETDITDEATLVEMLGAELEIVPGSAGNFKITKPVDLAAAEAVLSAGRSRE